ncbi:MAG: family 20 glycosylhydrolase, partial [Rhodoglobus sp.]
DALPVAEYLGEVLRPETGFPLPIALPTASHPGDLALVIEPGHPTGGYDLAVTSDGIRIAANDAPGLFAGVQTLRQLVAAGTTVAATTISDAPRFAYRGAMLDVARHFFPVDAVKKYIDDLALLKLNALHLHLTDDQGWRIAIDGWPKLTEIGASTQVNGGGGGYYTKDDYREIVAYAASRYITVVPEIDVPGHTNAVLASYPELTCDGDEAPAPYEGIEVGFSSLCIGKEQTYAFFDDVIGELVELTPGPWIHIGGDESNSTPEADFLTFVNRASAIVAAHGKTVIGWHEMGRSSELPQGTIGEYWSYTTPQADATAPSLSFLQQGGQLIMAPADVAYLDMKYDPLSPLGLVWANGPTSVEESYGWDPADILPGVGDDQLLGVEAPIWTETIVTVDDLESMAFPRIASVAEIAWSPREGRSWAEFAPRLAAFGAYLDGVGIRYERAAGVDWR